MCAAFRTDRTAAACARPLSVGPGVFGHFARIATSTAPEVREDPAMRNAHDRAHGAGIKAL
jgi:hypothetical protein